MTADAPLLSVRDLKMVFQLRSGLFAQVLGGTADVVRAVDGISFDIAAGETLALVGESGSGKTTTGRLITLQDIPTGGSIRFEGKEITGFRGPTLKAYRRSVQMIFQNPYESLDPRLTVAASVAAPLDIHGLGDARSRRARVEEMLAAVEMRPAAAFADRYPADLSGGQLQRVAIARALVLEPRLIVADEPVSMLDVSVRSGVMNLMLDLQRRMGVGCLYITHDLAVARHMSSRIAVMYLGAIVEEGPTDTLIRGAGHPYSRLLVAAVPEHRAGVRRARIRLPGDALSVKAMPSGCRFHPRCPMAVDVCRTTAPPRVSLGPGRWAACHFAADVADQGLRAA
jgi:oligopeptide/dipeptide ABC transporter ATP-binding protein